MSNNVVIDFYELKHNKNLLNTLIRQNNSQKYYSTKQSDLQKNIEKFNKAKEKIRQELIASDTSKDKNAIYTALTQFKKTNE